MIARIARRSKTTRPKSSRTETELDLERLKK
jgi:hypothetical protein